MRRKLLSSFFPLLLLTLAIVWLGPNQLRAADDELHMSGWVQPFFYDPPNETKLKAELSGAEATPISGSDGKLLLKGAKLKQFAVTGGDPQMTAEAPECVYDNRRKEASSPGPLKINAQSGRFFVEGVGFLLNVVTTKSNDSSLVISNQVHSLLQLQSGTNIPAAPLTEITSHRARFESKSGSSNDLAIYEGNVHVVDPKMKLAAELLTAELPRDNSGQSNRVNSIIVETNVVIDFASDSGEQFHATGDRAVYTPKSADGTVHELLELTGSPRVELTNGWMTADRFVLDRTTGKLHANGNYHFHYLGQTDAANSAATNATEFYSERFEFDLNTRDVGFWQSVRVDDARMKLASESLTTTLPRQGAGKNEHPAHILAETNVVIDLPPDRNGQKIHATGQKAVYDYKVSGTTTNEVIELTGNPVVQAANPVAWMTANLITVDRAQGRITGVGDHHSVFKKAAGEPATMDTEVFSERFDYATGDGLVVYRGSVRAYDPGMNAVSQTLTVKLAKTEPGKTNKYDSILAEGNVAVDFLEKAFYSGDITNLPAFAARMQKPADPVAQYVSSQLTDATRQLLAGYTSGTNAPLQSALITDLNQLTQRGALYDPARFEKVYLSLDTTELLHQQPLGVDLVELNRLLLLDAFRGQLKRNPQGETTHATGDRVFDHFVITGGITNEVLELTGHPKVETRSYLGTASEAIIYNRSTHVQTFVGQDSHRINLEGYVTPKPPAESKKGHK